MITDPATYPHFSIYPSVGRLSSTSELASARKANVSATSEPLQLVPKRKRNFTHAQLHEQVAEDPAPTDTDLPAYVARRKPRFTHAQLCNQVFEEPCEHTTCDEEELWEMITPVKMWRDM